MNSQLSPAAAAVTIEYFSDPRARGAPAAVQPPVETEKREIIRVVNASEGPASASAHATQLARQSHVPMSSEVHFALFTKLRFAKRTRTLQERLPLLRIRLQAFVVLIEQSSFHASSDVVNAFFTQDVDFVWELAELLTPAASVPEEVRLLALQALAVLSDDRMRNGVVRQAVGWGTQAGVLPSILNLAIPALIAGERHSVYTPGFVEGTLKLTLAILSSLDVHSAFNTNVVASVLPLLGDRAPEHRKVVLASLKVLEPVMETHENFGMLFKDLGGLQLCVERLQFEVENFVDDSSKTLMRQITKRVLRILLFLHSGVSPGMGRGTVIDAGLLTCLKLLLQSHERYGDALFMLAASVVAGMIQNEPQCFPSIEQAGIPAVVLEVVQTGRIPLLADAIAVLPNVISAFCLNQEWLKSIATANPLPAFLSIFHQPRYAVVLQGEACTTLGAAVDELFRHHPAVRRVGMASCVDILQKIRAFATTDRDQLDQVFGLKLFFCLVIVNLRIYFFLSLRWRWLWNPFRRKSFSC